MRTTVIAIFISHFAMPTSFLGNITTNFVVPSGSFRECLLVHKSVQRYYSIIWSIIEHIFLFIKLVLHYLLNSKIKLVSLYKYCFLLKVNLPYNSIKASSSNFSSSRYAKLNISFGSTLNSSIIFVNVGTNGKLFPFSILLSVGISIPILLQKKISASVYELNVYF